MENIIDKIISCLKLAETAEYNPNEAANALRAAKRLADKHGFDLATIQAEQEDKQVEDLKYEFGKMEDGKCRYTMSYEKYLSYVITQLFPVGTYNVTYGGQQGYRVFVGTKADAAIAVAVFHYLRKKLARCAKQQYGYHTWNIKHASYIDGFLFALAGRIQEVRKQPEKGSTGTALVLYGKHEQLKEFFAEIKGLKTKKHRCSASDDEAWDKGHEHGKKEPLNFAEGVPA